MPKYIVSPMQTAIARELSAKSWAAREIGLVLQLNPATLQRTITRRKTRLPSEVETKHAKICADLIDRAQGVSVLHLIMEWCDQSFVAISRHAGWWWVSYRNGKAYKARKLLIAIDRARHGGP